MPKYCGNIPLDCSYCYQFDALPCYAIINVPCTNLVHNTNYYFWIVDHFGNIFYEVVFGNANGSFDIDTTLFPIGIFTNDFGGIDTFISSDNSGLTIIPLTIGTSNYNCLIINIE